MRFHDVAGIDDVPLGEGRRVLVDGTAVALFRTDEGYVAFDDHCPHAGAPLSSGTVRDGYVVCTWHGFTFDVHTGACPLYPGAPSAKTRPVRVENGRVLVGGAERGRLEA